MSNNSPPPTFSGSSKTNRLTSVPPVKRSSRKTLNKSKTLDQDKLRGLGANANLRNSKHDSNVLSRKNSTSSKRPRRTRFSVFGALTHKTQRRKEPPKRITTKNEGRRDRVDSFESTQRLDTSRQEDLNRILQQDTLLDVQFDEMEQDDCNALYEELCCIRRQKSVQEKAEDTELFGRLGPPEEGSEEEGEAQLTAKERADLSREGTLVLARLLILPFVLAILMSIDVYKSYEVPDQETSERGGDMLHFNRTFYAESPIFYLPCGIQLMFNILIVVASALEWSWATSHKSRRRLQFISYLVLIVGISISEFAMVWPGFCDSSVWGLIGWIYSTSRASIRRCRDMALTVVAIYFLFNLLCLIWDDPAYEKILIENSPRGTVKLLVLLLILLFFWFSFCLLLVFLLVLFFFFFFSFFPPSFIFNLTKHLPFSPPSSSFLLLPSPSSSFLLLPPPLSSFVLPSSSSSSSSQDGSVLLSSFYG